MTLFTTQCKMALLSPNPCLYQHLLSLLSPSPVEEGIVNPTLERERPSIFCPYLIQLEVSLNKFGEDLSIRGKLRNLYRGSFANTRALTSRLS